jgi:hypothetical protein
MKKGVLFAVILALAAMTMEPVGWLLARKPVRLIHLEAALVIGIAVFAILGGACWLITLARKAQLLKIFCSAGSRLQL